MAFQEFSGKEYLKIDIANNFGLDKENWEERIAWFDHNEGQLENLLNQAKEPALFYAGVQAWRQVQKGQPSGYPISLDATSSGIQILAVLTGDPKAAALCNVVDTGRRQDAYTALYHAMLNRIGQADMHKEASDDGLTLVRADGKEDALTRAMNQPKITRDDTKRAIMTAFYSSQAVPKRVFGEGPLLDTFYETMQEEAPGPWELNETMLAIWNPEALSYDWVMPDNFHVKIKVMGTVTENVHFLNEPFEVNYSVNMPIEGGRSLGANMTHSVDGMVVREITRRCDYDKEQVRHIRRWIEQGKAGTSTSRENDQMIMRLAALHKESGFLSARVLQYVDPANMGHLDRKALSSLVQSLPAKPFKVLSVHDCFRVLPNYGNDLRRQYNQILSEMAASDLLSFLISQIMKRKIQVYKIKPEMHLDILETNYALS